MKPTFKQRLVFFLLLPPGTVAHDNAATFISAQPDVDLCCCSGLGFLPFILYTKKTQFEGIKLRNHEFFQAEGAAWAALQIAKLHFNWDLWERLKNKDE